MKKIFKQFIYTVTSAFLMLTPVAAGQCELQTEVPIYEVAEGQTLTEEEQKILEKTIDYFIQNPDVEYVYLNTDEFPNLSFDYLKNLFVNKLDYITEHYSTYDEQKDVNCYYNYLAWADHFNTRGFYSEYRILNCNVKEAIRIKNWVDYTYSLVPQIGVTDGMDEREAIDIINSFMIANFEPDYAYSQKYLTIHETHKGVCHDYSMLFKGLANGAGIEAYELASYSECHGWNQVIIDGNAYELDVMWNDRKNDNHRYYLLTREQMSKIGSHRYIEEVF